MKKRVLFFLLVFFVNQVVGGVVVDSDLVGTSIEASNETSNKRVNIIGRG